jgi:hypothetical protein
MKKKHLLTLWSAIVIFVFITSLFSTVPAFADDSTPPPATEEPVLPPTEEPAAETEPAPTDQPEVDPTSTPEAVDPAPTPEVDTPAEVLESAPEGVNVVVLDENGDALPLVTEEAAQIIMAGDPMWCPEGVTPGTDTLDQCTPAYADFASLITELDSGGYAGNGTIYVAYDYAQSEGLIYINHDSTGLLSLADLVIQGGWDFGNDGMYNNDPSSQSTLDGTWLYIDNWVGNVTINNLFIANSNEDGLVIVNDGDVNLDQVNVDDSDLSGAYIISTGDVNVSNSDFTNNGAEGYYDNTNQTYEAQDGLYVETSGDVTLSDVYSAGNGANGATILGADVGISDSVFEDNGWGEDDGYGAYWDYDEYIDGVTEEYSEEFYGGNGLTIDASDDVTLSGLEVYNNAGNGADIEAAGDISIANSNFAYNGNLGFINVSNEFYEDGDQSEAEFDLEYYAGSGLIAEAGGDITLIEVVASENANGGADLDSNVGDILITGSVFEYNGEGGDLFDECGCGYVLMLDYMDDFCGWGDGYGFDSLLFNPCEDSGYIEVQGANFEYQVNVYGNEEGYQNYYEILQSGGSGLIAEAYDGSVILEDVGVNGNAGEGAYIYGFDDVQITSSSFDENGFLGYLSLGECFGEGMQGCFYANEQPVAGTYAVYLDFEYGDGLHVDADGNITLSDVTASDNSNNGALVHSNGSVFIENGEFSYNADPIYIGGEGGLFGYFLYDQFGLEESVFIPASEFEMEVGFFEGEEDGGGFAIYMDLDSGDGLEVEANSIALTGVSAEENAGDGANMDAGNAIQVSESNFSGNGFGSDGFMSYGIFNQDGYESEGSEAYMSNGNGLYMESDGSITLSGVTANDNGLYGAEIYADSNVFVEDSQFSGNGLYGFASYEYYNSYGYYDEGLGQFVVIEEEEGSGEWYGSGLYIESDGNVTLKDVDANGNYLDGAEIYSDGGSILVMCGNYNENGEYGIYAQDASSLALYGPVILGNGNSPDEYFFDGPVTISEDCTIPSPPANEKKEKYEGVSSVCEGTTTATFLLPSGDFVVFPCPINDQAFVKAILEKDLPEKLEEGIKFLSALNTNVIRDNAVVEELEKPVVVSFIIPQGIDPQALSILFWDGTKWVELEGQVSADGLYFEVSTNLAGTFVLVSK